MPECIYLECIDHEVWSVYKPQGRNHTSQQTNQKTDKNNSTNQKTIKTN